MMLRDEEGRETEQQRRWEMIREQRPPVTTDGSGPAVWDLVIEDMRQRNADGTAKYGTPLRTFNGRDPLTDLYQELLDAVVYCRQEKARRDKLREQDGYTLTVLVAERDEARMLVQSLTAERDGWKVQAENIAEQRDRACKALDELIAEKAKGKDYLRHLDDKRDQLEEQVRVLTAQREEFTRQNTELRNKLISAAKETNRLMTGPHPAVAKELEKLRAGKEERLGLLQKLNQVGIEADGWRIKAGKLTTERDDLAKQLADARAGLVAVTEERDMAQQTLANVRADRDACRTERDEARRTYGFELARTDRLTKERDELATEKTRACKTAEDLLNELSRTRAERDGAKAELRRAFADRDEAQKHSEESGKRAAELQGRVNRLEGELAAFRKVVQVIADPPK